MRQKRENRRNDGSDRKCSSGWPLIYSWLSGVSGWSFSICHYFSLAALGLPAYVCRRGWKEREGKLWDPPCEHKIHFYWQSFHQLIHLQAYWGRLWTLQGHFCFLWSYAGFTHVRTHTHSLSLPYSLHHAMKPNSGPVSWNRTLSGLRKRDPGLGKTWASAWPLQTEAPQAMSAGADGDQNWAELKRHGVPFVQSEQRAGPRAPGLGDATESDGVRACASCSPVMDGAGVATTHQCHVNKHRWLNVDEVPYNHSHGIHRRAELALWLRGLNLIAESN